MFSLLDIIWPRKCEICGRPADRPGRYLCSDCLMRLPMIPVTGCCRKCGRDVPELDREYLCEDCRTHRPAFDRVASALRFEEDARQLLLDYKFKRSLWLKNDFVDLLEGVARARFKVEEIDLVLPMPTTLRHRIDRGYNQCDYLAAGLAKRLGRPFLKHGLRRVGDFERQGGLDEERRRTNVIGTFEVTSAGRRRFAKLTEKATVLVLDDIMTTGATLSECAKTIKESGISRVWCVSLCRSIRV